MSQADARTIRFSDPAERVLLHTGDVVLYRGKSAMSDVIQHITQSDYSHAAMIGKLYSEDSICWWAQAETIQRYAARLIDLDGEIKRFPGRYDVFRVREDLCPSFNDVGAWRFMLAASGNCYGWRYITRIYLRRRLGRIVPAIRNSYDPTTNRDCSGLVHAAIRCNGGPAVKQYDCDVAPGNLSDGRYFSYVGTLFP